MMTKDRGGVEHDQHFLSDRKVLRIIVGAAGIRPGDVILEAGSGRGILTVELARRAGEVIAVEIDGKLIPELRHRLRGRPNVRIVRGNALDAIGKESFDKLVSNPPYAIVEPMVRLLARKEFDLAVLTLPGRFARRLSAKEGDDSRSVVSVFAQCFFDVRIIGSVPREAWDPAPSTESHIVSLRPRQPRGPGERALREMFLQDDKVLKNALREALIRTSGGKLTKRMSKGIVSSSRLGEALEKKVSSLGMKDLSRVKDAIDSIASGIS